MAITVQNVADFASTHIKIAPIIGVGGIANEPSLSWANNVLQTVLGRPYNWWWNRTTLLNPDGTYPQLIAPTTPGVNGKQDFVFATSQTAPQSRPSDYGWMEKAIVYLSSSTTTPPSPIRVVKVAHNMYMTDEVGDPLAIEYRGLTYNTVTQIWYVNIRTYPAVGRTGWRLIVEFQKEPPVLTALTQNFDPIPDRMGRVIRHLFLSYAYQGVDDRRADQELAKGLAFLQEERGKEDIPQQDFIYPGWSPFLG